MLPGDSGEYQFAAYILGIAHPTGYPLYLMLGWLWSHALQLGDVAYRMNLFSALWAALAVGLSYVLALRVVSRAAPRLNPAVWRLAAVCASATFGLGQMFWSKALVAESYSLNAFFVVLVLLLLLRLMEAPFSLGRGLALGVAFGLSLDHHRTMLLLLPGMLVYAWLTYRRGMAAAGGSSVTPRALWRFALVLAAGALVPLLLYLYLPLRAPYVPYATLSLSGTQTLVLYQNSWRGFLDHVMGTVFAGNILLSPGQAATSGVWAERLAMVWQLLRNQVGLVGVALAVVGLVRLAFSRAWPLVVLTLLCYLAGVGFNLIYAIGDVADLFIPSYLFVSMWIGAGVAALAEAVTAGVSRRSRVTSLGCGLAWAIGIVGLALPATLLAANLPNVDQSFNTAAANMWQPILARPLPPGAVLLTNDRDEMMPLWYYQYVEGRRPDLLGLFPRIVADPAYEALGGLVDEALASGRPVYLIKSMPGLEVKAQLEASADMAPLIRVLGPATGFSPGHSSDATFGGGVMRLAGYDLSPAVPRPGDAVTVTLYWQPQSQLTRDYTSYVHVVGADGATVAQSDLRPGGVYYPTSSWRPGEVLRDTHVIGLSPATAPGDYRLLAGMYEYPSMEALGDAVEVGRLVVR